MSITGGLTSAGFVAPTVDELKTDLAATYLATIDGGLDLSSDQPMGQIVQITADDDAREWETVQAAYNALDPANAEGTALDTVGALRGIPRLGAAYSKAYGVLCTLAGGQTLSAGATVYVNGQPSNTWSLLSSITNTGGSPAQVPGTFVSTTTGPNVTNASTLTQIATPVTGWTAVTNPTDAALGRNVETDTAYRVRMLRELSLGGLGSVDAQRASLLQVAGVIDAFVFENVNDFPDAYGTTAHSTHAVIWDGATPAASDTAIAQTIWAKKGGGAKTYGGTTANATDAAGNLQSISFDRATQKPVYITCIVTPAPGVAFGATEAAAVKASLAAYASLAFRLSTNVFYTPLADASIVAGVSVDAPVFEIGFSPSPTGTSTLLITLLQIPTLDTSHITVNGF